MDSCRIHARYSIRRTALTQCILRSIGCVVQSVVLVITVLNVVFKEVVMKTSTQIHSQIGKILKEHKINPVFGVDSIIDVMKMVAMKSIKDAVRIRELYRELKNASHKEEWCA